MYLLYFYTFKVLVNMWVKTFETNPRIGTIKLFTVVINCFDVDVCIKSFVDFNPSLMFEQIIQCFKILVCHSINKMKC